MGNEGRNQTRSPGNYRSVVSVSASNRKNRVASFSGGGNLTINNHIYTVPDLVAPGEQVYSAIVQGGYEAWDGTSMAETQLLILKCKEAAVRISKKTWEGIESRMLLPTEYIH